MSRTLDPPVPPADVPPNTTHPPSIVDDLLVIVGANGMAIDAVQNAQDREPTTVDGVGGILGESVLPLVVIPPNGDPGPGASQVLLFFIANPHLFFPAGEVANVFFATETSADPDPPGGGPPPPDGGFEEPLGLQGIAPQSDWLLA